ncbi:MAG: hypothetical protein ABIO45_18815 [Burkholderiaceae bacterium]
MSTPNGCQIPEEALTRAERRAEFVDFAKPARMPSGDRTAYSTGEGLHR